MSSAYILVVDDEVAVREMVEFTLKSVGFTVGQAACALEARESILERMPDLLILDWMMPGLDGIEFARRLRREEPFSELPIIMLTARVDEDDRLSGFDAGVDDYVIKPFSPRELVARVKAILRRSMPTEGASTLEAGVLQLDIDSHRVKANGQAIDLGSAEFGILRYMMSNIDRVLSRSQLLDHVWGHNSVVEERTVDVHIMRLRKVLKSQDLGDYIQTVRGAGYRFFPQT